jgi:hypothetical protein
MTRILRGLTSERLDCGCVRGVYETYDGRVITVLDAVGEACQEPGHETGHIDEMAVQGLEGPDSHATL